MSKKKQPKSSCPSRKPVRVVNPTARWHTSRLYPRQPLIIMLRKPSMFLENVSDDAEFKVSAYSEFLIIEEMEEDTETGDKVFTINQKFDLSGWAEYGEVLLGEINITLHNNNHAKAHKQNYKSSICVIQHGREDTLTVVNPVAHTVKVEPHQLLEIVCFEPAWNNWEPGKVEAAGLRDQWSFKATRHGENRQGLAMTQVRYEIAGDRSGVLTPEEGQFAIKNRFGLTVNPRLSPVGRGIVEQELAAMVKPVREHHWWFACDKSTLKSVLNLRNDSYEVGSLDFEGKCSEAAGEPNYTTLRTVDVLLSVRGKKKHKMHPYHINPDSVEHKMELIKRAEDRARRVLSNPLSTEQVDFDSGFQEVTIEIAQPTCMWADLPDTARWEFKVDETRLAPKHVKIELMDNYYRWGKLFQRAKITHDFSPKNDTETKFLGAVFVVCPGKEDHHDGKKRIAFWLTPGERKQVTTWTAPRSSASTTSSSNSNYSGCSGGFSGNGKKKEKDYQRPRVATLEIEEIDGELLNDSVKTRLHKDIWVSSSYHQSYCGPMAYNAHDFYPAKKKAGYSTSDYPRRTFKSASETENERSEGSSEKAGGTGSSSGTSRTTTPSAAGNSANTVPSLIVYNPDHNHRVTLSPGQNLIVRLAQPHKVLLNKATGEMWSLCHKTARSQMSVHYWRTVNIGETFYQETLIEPKNLNPVPGVQTVGQLDFECSADKRTLYIQVDMKDGDDARRSDFSFPHMRVVEPTRRFQGGSDGGKMYISDWCHMDAVVANFNEAMYIRSPAYLSNWRSTAWTLEIQQCPLPEEVLRHPTVQAIIDDVDMTNPWFKTSQPLQLASTYVFRPFAIQQPHAKVILQAAADVFGEEIIPLATLVFRNDRNPNNIRLQTPVGMVETRFSIERTLGVCVSLKEFFRKEVLLADPDNKEEVALHGNETLIIKLSPKFMELERGVSGKMPWFIGAFPNFLAYEGQSTMDGDDVFRFKVRDNYPERKNDWVKFICGNSEKSVLAKYEK